MPLQKTLLIGGARSGKSRLAEEWAHQHDGPVTVIATAEALDDEMQARITRHRQDRPAHFITREEPRALAQALQAQATPDGLIIVDCLTLWLTNLLSPLFATTAADADASALPLPAILGEETAALYATLPTLPGRLILIANEVGQGLVPEHPLGRLFRDEAGRLNQQVATLCTDVILVTAGLPLPLKRAGEPCHPLR